MKYIFTLYSMSFETGFAPINAKSILTLINNNFLVIALSVVSLITAAVLCYFAISYLVLFWNYYLGTEGPKLH